MRWKFITTSMQSDDRLEVYPWQSAVLLTDTCVVTKAGRIDMAQPDFNERVAKLEWGLQQRALLLRLAWLCRVDRLEAQTRHFEALLRRVSADDFYDIKAMDLMAEYLLLFAECAIRSTDQESGKAPGTVENRMFRENT